MEKKRALLFKADELNEDDLVYNDEVLKFLVEHYEPKNYGGIELEWDNAEHAVYAFLDEDSILSDFRFELVMALTFTGGCTGRFSIVRYGLSSMQS